MTALNILHVTDFHIANPQDEEAREHLREGFFDEYLGALHRAFVKGGAPPTVDLIVATGDFVDCGRTENFGHAASILQHFGLLWSVATNSIVTCTGNHDIVRDLEKSGESDAAREGYRNLAEQFAASESSVLANGVAWARVADSGAGMVSLDSTIGGIDKPGRLSGGETDSVVRWIKTLPNDTPVILASHFPVDLWAASLGPFNGEDDWAVRHIWHAARALRGRLLQQPRPVIWFCGDIHRYSLFRHENMSFVTTGRVGVSGRKPHGEFRRQATIISIQDGDIRAWQAEYESESGDVAQLGRWSVKEASFHVLKEGEGPRPGSQRDLASQEVSIPSGTSIVDEEFSREIAALIAEDGLYSFGRFEVASGRISLGWVDVAALLTFEALLEPVAVRMGRWIKSALSERGSGVVLVGIDSWGGVLAALISAMTSIPYVAVSSGFVRDGSRLDNGLVETLSAYRTIVLVGDVVGTGRSLARFHELVLAQGGAPAADFAWLLASFICDTKHRRESLDFLERHGVICADVRIPVMSADELPGMDILPVRAPGHLD